MFLEKNYVENVSSNYTDWVRSPRSVLTATQKAYVFDAPLDVQTPTTSFVDVVNTWQSKVDDYSIVQCAMLYGLESGLQRRFECHGAYEMFQELKLIFQANTRVERYEVSNKFYS